MQQSALFRLVAALALIFSIAGCGGGSSSSKLGAPATITISPATASLQTGQVLQLSASVQDKNGNVLAGVTPTWTSDKTAVAQVSSKGLVCAGTWDATFINCTPGAVGTVNIVASASGINSAPAVLSVHQRIANLTLSAPSNACLSQSKTEQISVVARDAAGNDITSTVGTVSFAAVNASVATIDANGLATAKQPGQTQIVGTVSNITSLPVTFTTCAPATIVLGTQSSSPLETSFTVAVGATKTLAATVTDVLGNPITDINLAFSSVNPNVFTGTGTATSITLTATNAGTTSIVAGCAPPACNPGVTAVYSNVVVGTVTGTSATTVYATGTGATTIVPIDSTANTVGTALTIPTTSVSGTAVPLAINSFVFARTGSRAFLGADHGVLIMDATNNSFIANITNIQGKVLAVSPNGNKAIVSDPANAKVHVFDGSTNTFEDFGIANAVAADWTPDGIRAFIISTGAGGNTLYVYSPIFSIKVVPLSGAANDVTVLSQGSVAYLAGAAAPLTLYATCDNSQIGTVAASATPLLLRSTVDSAHVLGLTGSSIIDDALSVGTQPCPPSASSNTVTEHSFGATFTPNKLIVDSAGAHAYATSNTTGILAYDISAGTTSTIALGTGATGATTGDITLDGKQLYVGALGTNDVHVIDTASALEVKQIAVGLKKSDGTAVSPGFVVIRPK